ncbi:MAG: electron transport complex subunit RsxC [Thiomicrospira sp.]|uniref:electron transport complex subunit RsxC n=1 Tax=Thiomicrospira sp. TaxID=935 RepID=UPI0019DBB688|nr:electron transport complex subunit RsxC [Thiomicrospira sp.]MBE0493600.1 electron transport complex subunit RsxC [Thiomicrospira sp.]
MNIRLHQKLINLIASIYPMAKRWLHQFHGGVFPKYNKSLSLRQPLRTSYVPKQLILPLQQHMGEAALPCVEVGEQVKKFQMIAQPAKGLSAPVHAPASGKIIAIEQRILPHASGLAEPCIVIEPDAKQDAIENALGITHKPKTIAEFKQLLLNAGIVGMGGAGFPTFAKLPDQPKKIKHLIINGAECEPFITCDDLLMQTHAPEIVRAALFVAELFDVEQVICGIETNKPQAIEAMRQACEDTRIRLEEVATVYPMGGQKQLTQELIGVEIPSQLHSIDIGVVMMNVATLRAITQAIELGQPLISRFVTVSGMGLKKPYNIEALLGTPFNELVELAQPEPKLNYPLLMGGPMMGFAVAHNDVPVIKTTNCILANPPETSDEPMACIRCGECAEACPVSLLPQQLYWHARAHEYDKTEQLKLFDCIECGCCSFVCPSHIPLVQYYRHAKAEIREIKQQAKLTEIAKQRFDAREARLERDKHEREAKLAAKKAAVKQQAADAPKVEKTAADAPKLSAREKAIQAAKARQKASQTTANEKDATAKKASRKDNSKPAETAPAQSANDKRQAAMQAAKARAAALKAQKTASTETPANLTEQAQASSVEDTPSNSASAEDKRKAAMDAAKAKAAERKKRQQESSQ